MVFRNELEVVGSSDTLDGLGKAFTVVFGYLIDVGPMLLPSAIDCDPPVNGELCVVCAYWELVVPSGLLVPLSPFRPCNI